MFASNSPSATPASSCSQVPCCSAPCGCSSCATFPEAAVIVHRDASSYRPAVRLLHDFAPAAAIVLAFLLVFGLLGGWLLAGRMLAPLTQITEATRMAANGSLSHRIRLPGRKDEFRDLADAFDTMLARLEAHTPNSRGSRPTPPTNCAPRWPSRRHFSTWPATIRTATPANSSTASTPSTPEQWTSPSIATTQPRRPAVLHPRSQSTCPS